MSLLVLLIAACSGAARTGIGPADKTRDGGTKDDGGTDIIIDDDGGRRSGCTNLECQIDDCGPDSKTTLTGKVVAPTPSIYGKPDPIYNAIVYIPNGDVEPFAPGVSCDKCGTPVSGSPIAVALTNEKGEFVLEDVPSGDSIPLVIQIGRWRRQVTIDTVEKCTETQLDTDLTRLPRNSKEGDIPQIAVATSVYDPTECILRKIGIDESEFTPSTGKGRVHIYEGNGATIGGAKTTDALTASAASLSKYDLIAFPCSAYPESASAKLNVVKYAAAGGRVYVTDLSYPTISEATSNWPATATWDQTGIGGGNQAAQIDVSFAKGKALAEWLYDVGATPQKGHIDLEDTYQRFTKVSPLGQRWVYTSSEPQTYSFNTPVGAAEEDQCGRVVYSSFHIAQGDFGGGGNTFPQECSPGPMTPQEKILEFMLFDLSSCVQKDDKPPIAPPK